MYTAHHTFNPNPFSREQSTSREENSVQGWLSVDPLAHEFPQWSPYVAFADNPIFYVDPDGQKFINFDAEGNYTGTTKDNWWHNLWHGSKGRQTLADGSVNKFRFADPKNDVADIQSGVITKLVTVQESQIKSMLLDAGAFNSENRAKPASFLLREGKGDGGKFDFSYTAIPDMFPGASTDPLKRPSPFIFLVDDVAHNHMNFGNFLFGAGGATLGVHLGALRIGGHYNSLFNPETNAYDPQFDSADDQYSIKLGFHYARGGGLFNRWFGNARAWDKQKEGFIEVGPLEYGGVVEDGP